MGEQFVVPFQPVDVDFHESANSAPPRSKRAFISCCRVPRRRFHRVAARIVIGADGLHSRVARETKPQEYHVIPSLTFAYYTYWSGPGAGRHQLLLLRGLWHPLPSPRTGHRSASASAAASRLPRVPKDIPGNYMKVIDRMPELAEQVRAGKQEQRYLGTADQPNYFRSPTAPAGRSSATPATTATSSPASASTTHSATPISSRKGGRRGFSGDRPLDEAMAAYQATRDDSPSPSTTSPPRWPAVCITDLAEFMKFGPAIARNLPSMMNGSN